MRILKVGIVKVNKSMTIRTTIMMKVKIKVKILGFDWANISC